MNLGIRTFYRRMCKLFRGVQTLHLPRKEIGSKDEYARAKLMSKLEADQEPATWEPALISILVDSLVFFTLITVPGSGLLPPL